MVISYRPHQGYPPVHSYLITVSRSLKTHSSNDSSHLVKLAQPNPQRLEASIPETTKDNNSHHNLNTNALDRNRFK